jgi:hypothetical protein
MHTLLVALFLSGPIEAHGTKLNTTPEQHATQCEAPLTPVILVADGSSEWPGQAVNRIVGELKAALGSCHALQVARFDAEPTLQLGFTVRGTNRDLVVVRPRTPMREVMEAGFAQLIGVPSRHIMVIMAHEQFYPTTVSTSRLIELARRSETKVHTIHLASGRAESGIFRRLGRTLRDGIVRLIKALGMEERGSSPRDTERLLQVMADATGGKACIAADEHTRIECARSIAAAIMSSP